MLDDKCLIANGGTVILFLLSAKIIIQILQRIFFHPLRSIPGPIINKFSEFPAALALVAGDQHIYYKSLHDRYGPVVRVSPNELSFISVGAREEIYGFRKGGKLMEKSPIFLGAVGNVNGETGVSLALNKDHTRQRKALGNLFTNSALLKFEGLMKLQIKKLIRELDRVEAEDQPVDVSSWFTYLAFDIMGDLCFAEPFGCLDQASSTDWSTSVINVFVAATWTQAIRRLTGTGTLVESLMTWLLVPAKAAEWRNIHLRNSREKTIRRLADTNRDHADFMYHILKDGTSKSLSQNEVVLNMALFISAGTDTTATALTGWAYLICTNPNVYKRLIDEVRRSLTGENDLNWEKVRHLRYLEATIFEALRLFPPSPASQQRIVPSGGATIDGQVVPEGTTVAVPPWVSTHSSLHFREPDAFRPERWLAEDVQYSRDHLNASLPFGTGPRVCIGKNLAYMEMRMTAASLLQRFDMALDTECFGARNRVWGVDGKIKTMKIFHSMTKPELWVRFQKADDKTGTH